MKTFKIQISLLLMSGSIVLLLLLQAWWLQTEYRTVKDSFQRETDLVFRSTIKQIADSAMFKHLNGIGFISVDKDTITKLPRMPLLHVTTDSLRARADMKIESIRVEKSDKGNGSIVINRSFELSRTKQDSFRIWSSPDAPKDFRFIFDFGADYFDTDTLFQMYKAGLSKKHSKLEILILEKTESLPTMFIPNDSLHFTTSFYRLGGGKLYAAQFENGNMYIIREMLPQIAFSIFLSALILCSFGLVYTSLKFQQRLLQQKNEFMANVTHELKTPIATVGVALEAIRDFDVLKDQEKTQSYLGMAEKEIQRLNNLTDKILKTAIFDYQQEIRIHKEPLDLTDIIHEVLNNMKMAFDVAGMTFQVLETVKAEMMGNKEHLIEMLQNIFDNSLKYAGVGNVLIHVFDDEKYVFLQIGDEGKGIEEEHLPYVLDKFYRVPITDIHDVKGYGLGLSYVSGVVMAHKGTIRLENKVNGGLLITITFHKQT